jgi:1,4-alpha-glucan branching enzyme
MENTLDYSQIDRLAEQKESNPHCLLGLHGNAIKLWRPGASIVHLEVLGQIVEANQIDPRGLFEFISSQKLCPTEYRIFHANGLLDCDPYSFEPLIGELDRFLFNAGCHYELFEILGANFHSVNGVNGVLFSVWAPNAEAVSLVGDFNHWDGRVNPLRSMDVSGIWELFIPGLEEGALYKFELRTKKGQLLIKSDPFAHFAENRPSNASIVFDVNRHKWQDAEWMCKRSNDLNQPMNIYEVHLGSWKNGVKGYRELAVALGQYCLDMGFTHLELMPIMEHPLDESWGYQVTGFYAVTSRFGTPEDFQFFVDHLHAIGIGLILDWVPAHFPVDDFSLIKFDGTALYEHEDPFKGFHPQWNTAIFNYGRKEVVNFLIGSALYWIEKMHVDGLRVDAVSSMLYLDYARNPGEWTPNTDGSNVHLEAIEFIKHLTSIVRERNPSIFLIAEESSSFSGVTALSGLGFDLKWNMGWMNDTLRYFSEDPINRKYHHNHLTFSLLYSFSEKFMLPLSHDEIVHMKKSLLSKMPGPDWQKFASMRLLYSYMIGHPGKKLLFMGGELGQWTEWDCKGEITWDLLKYPLHKGLSDCICNLNHFYQKQPALWVADFSWEGYEWVDFSDAKHSVISYLRKGNHTTLLFVHNFTPEFRENYQLPLKYKNKLKELFNTDALCYGGSGNCNLPVKIEAESVTLSLPSLGTIVFEVFS